uniref:Uncharacterized protein n=1 Tax=Anguilla anguilla TaxID=7936 RepID=A0A0E9XB18_ANGAN
MQMGYITQLCTVQAFHLKIPSVGGAQISFCFYQ